MRALLDVNVLIALLDADHTAAWASDGVVRDARRLGVGLLPDHARMDACASCRIPDIRMRFRSPP